MKKLITALSLVLVSLRVDGRSGMLFGFCEVSAEFSLLIL